MTVTDAIEVESLSSEPLVEPIAPRGRLVFFLFGLAFVHGLALNLMPVLFQPIGETFKVSKTQQGLLQTSFMVGMITASILAGYLINYLGAKRVATVVIALSGLGALLFGIARSYALVLASAMVMGMGVSALTVVYAAVITSKFADIRQRMYMLTFAMMAASATFSTLIFGDLVKRFGYHIVFITFGLFIWLWLAALLAAAGRALDAEVGRLHHQEGAQPLRRPVPAENKSYLLRFMANLSRSIAHLLRFIAAGVLNKGALYLLGIMVVLDTLASGNLLAWAPTYFSETYKMRNIGLVLSASSLGVCAGRLLLSALPPGFISDRTLLALCYTGSMVAFGLILLLRPGQNASLFLIALSGAFVSAQAPTTYSIATAKFGERAPAAIPLIDAMGNFGGLAGAPLLGFLADRTGDLGAMMWSIPICGFALVALAMLWELFDRARGIRVASGIRAAEL